MTTRKSFIRKTSSQVQLSDAHKNRDAMSVFPEGECCSCYDDGKKTHNCEGDADTTTRRARRPAQQLVRISCFRGPCSSAGSSAAEEGEKVTANLVAVTADHGGCVGSIDFIDIGVHVHVHVEVGFFGRL